MKQREQARRLDLSLLGRADRRATRVGITVAGAAAVAVIATGSGLVPASSIRVTPRGATTVLADWVVVVPLLAIATAAYLIVVARPDRRWRRIALAVLAGSWAGTIQLAISDTAWAYADPMPTVLWAARIATWVAIGLAAGAALVPDRGRRSVIAMAAVSAAPFILLAGAYLLAVSAGGPLHLVRSALRDAMSTVFYVSLDVLIVLFLWQAVEGVHASKVAVVATISRWRATWVTTAVGVKVIALILAMVFVPPSVSPALEAFRTDGPFAWAYAIVLAVGVVTLQRRDALGEVNPTQRTVGAALLLLGFIAPGLLAGAYVGLLAPLRLLLPGSVPEAAGLAVAAAVATGVIVSARGRTRIALVTTLGATILVGILLFRPLSEAATPLVGLHNRFLDVGGWLVDLHERWTQPWAVLVMLLALVAGGVAVNRWRRGTRVSGALLAVAAIGIWAAPRTVQVGADEFTDTALSIAPDPLTFDVALLLVVVGTIAGSLISRRRLPVDTISLGAAVAVMSAVTLGPELIRPVMEAVLRALEGPLSIDQSNLGFALLLVLPAAYAYAFDSAALNARAASGAPMTAVGMTALIFGFAVLQLALATQPDARRDLVGVLFLVPLAALAAIGIGHRIAATRVKTPNEETL